ncbi:RNA polymerase sigma factor SigJ [Cellulomonas hominis]|uniref:RNA polymerase sigma factor SigJ n=1 Tax=Cellulomonas hominis TaxID=156981 RepID=UPI001BCBE51F|nr:RNA polymerase sigma factor SigJ [Cellulomonas hominis]
MSPADDVFLRHRGLVFTIAYDLLGSVADAEDVVQDAYERWTTRTVDPDDARAYLARLATNRCLDVLRSAQRTRVDYVGPWLPEPLPTGDLNGGPEERAVEVDRVSAALLVLLQTLGDRERACYALREVFGFSYADVAHAGGGHEAAVRQAVHRARERVQARRERFAVDPRAHADVVAGFLAAARDGDVAGLLALLAPGVVLTVDGGGRVTAARRPVHGADAVVRFLLGLRARQGSSATVAPVVLNGQTAALAVEGGVVSTTFQFAVGDGVVQEIYVVRNPDKLARVVRPRPGGSGPRA